MTKTLDRWAKENIRDSINHLMNRMWTADDIRMFVESIIKEKEEG